MRQQERVVIPAQPRTAKAEQTRAAIVDAALVLFREHGFENTTMRAIAQKAGVATGNAYYYFGSKEALVREFFAQIQSEHTTAALAGLGAKPGIGDRQRVALRLLVETLGPYHEFGGKLCGCAFGSPSARAEAMAVFDTVVTGARQRVPAGLRDRLPGLLWLQAMAIMAYWAHDKSPGCQDTYRLIDRVVPLTERMIRLARVPGMRSVWRQLLDLADAIRD